MTARTHDIIAFASLLTIAVYSPPQQLNITTATVALVGSVIGALAPDLDQATNRLWDLLPAGNFFGEILRKIMLHHRTISHSLVGIILFFLILSFLVPIILNPSYINTDIVTFSIMIGFISHIAADMFTKDGIPLLFPLPFKIGIPPFETLRIPTGKFVEKYIIFPAVLVYIFWLATNKKEVLLALVKLIGS